MLFRKDIEILRAIAIIQVLFFHLNIKFFEYGFLGVDIFFVISGFLMASLYKETNFKSFYIKRINRLLPSYYLTLLITVILAFFFIDFSEFRETIKQVWFSLVFISNIGFWYDNTYFNKDYFRPLLHLWSLAIEFQFYIIVPILALILSKNKVYIYILFAISLLFCFIATEISPKTSFFIIFFRVWEFLIGYLIASNKLLKDLYKKKSLLLNISSCFLLVFLLFLTYFYSYISDLNVHASNYVIGHPGFAALMICFLTGVILIIGIPKFIQDSFIGAIFVKIGNYSYSIYLLHYPIIIIYLYKPFMGTITTFNKPIDIITIFFLTITCSILFQKIILSKTLKKFYNYKNYILVTVFIFITSWLLILIKEFSLDPKELKVYNASLDKSEFRCGKLVRVFNPWAKLCILNKSNKIEYKDRVLLIGDSHADSIKTAFTEVGSLLKKEVWFVVANDPLMGNKKSLSATTVLAEIVKNKISHVIIHYSSILGLSELEKFMSLSHKKNIRVSFIMPIPANSFRVPEALYNKLKYNKNIKKQNLESYNTKNKETLKIIEPFISNKFKAYSVANIFCKIDCIINLEDGTPLYYDSHHLSLSGASLLKPIFTKILK